MAHFVIVLFPETNEVEIISSLWLGEDEDGNTQCRWPNYQATKALQGAKKHESPSAAWPWFQCEVLRNGTAGMISAVWCTINSLNF